MKHSLKHASKYTSIDDRDMLNVGLEIADVDKQKIASRRAKKGECEKCGQLLFKIGLLKKKIPLNVDGKVLEGCCLICYPLTCEDHLVNRSPKVVKDIEFVPPQILRLPERKRQASSDDSTMVSAITMDRRLIECVEHQDHSQNSKDCIKRRSEPTEGDEDTGAKPVLPKPVSDKPNQSLATEKKKREIETAEKLYASWNTSITTQSTGLKEIFFDSARICDLQTAEEEEETDFSLSDVARTSQPMDIFVEPASLGLNSSDDNLQHEKHKVRVPTKTGSLEDERFSGSAQASLKTAKCACLQSDEAIESMFLPSAVDDIPLLLQALADESATRSYESQLRTLSIILMASGQKARTVFVESKGIELLTKAMWLNMCDTTLQEACVELLFLLAASTDADPSSDVLVGDKGQDSVDALLFIMQTLIHNEKIQQSGCRVLYSLASASANNPEVNDGTLVGAVNSALDAMDAHQRSDVVQELGVRTLYQQCACSRNAANNMRSLIRSKSSKGTGGAGIVLRALENARPESALAEWACKLYWCLSAGEDVAVMLSPATETLNELLQIVRSSERRQGSVLVLQAALGAISNLVKIDSNKDKIDVLDAMFMALEAMEDHKDHLGLNIEACCLIANLAMLTPNKDILVEHGKIDLIFAAVGAFPDDATLLREAINSLLCLSTSSVSVKKLLSEPAVLSIILKLCHRHGSSASLQECVCLLLSSLLMHNPACQTGIESELLDAICFAMKQHAELACVQEPACVTLRALSRHEDCRELFVRGEALGLVLRAMKEYETTKYIQMSGCYILWNLGLNSLRTQHQSIEIEGVKCVVNAIQNHLEATEILEVACGALWVLMHNSDIGKDSFVDHGGIDALVCMLVMHPDTPALLERVCAVLVGISTTSHHAQAIIEAQGLVCVIDAMRSNNSSISLLRYAASFFKNLLLSVKDCIEEAEGAITIILNAMQASNDIAFQREACLFLWTISSLSEDSKSKILALDGISVIMSTLEQNNVGDVQEAALLAFNQLALTSSN